MLKSRKGPFVILDMKVGRSVYLPRSTKIINGIQLIYHANIKS